MKALSLDSTRPG